MVDDVVADTVPTPQAGGDLRFCAHAIGGSHQHRVVQRRLRREAIKPAKGTDAGQHFGTKSGVDGSFYQLGSQVAGIYIYASAGVSAVWGHGE